jgi:catechol 2,3-dioxygenase-like lactoylglutathione lyase family enzyme
LERAADGDGEAVTTTRSRTNEVLMLTDAPIVAFTATTQPDKAIAFYRDTLGLALVEESDYALVFRGAGTMLRVQRVAAFEPQPFTALGWDVPDIRATIAALTAAGVTPERNPYVEFDAAGIWWAPDGTGVAWFKDPDGNTLSLTQFPTH